MITNKEYSKARSDLERLLIMLHLEPKEAAAVLEMPIATVYAYCKGARRLKNYDEVSRILTEYKMSRRAK